MKIKLKKEGNIFNNEKNKVIEYVKIGNYYHFKIYKLKNKKFESISENEFIMTKKQLEIFLCVDFF